MIQMAKYICDYGGDCVRVFSNRGIFQYSFSDKGNTSHKLIKPHSICVAGDLVYVSEWGNAHCVSVFTKEGQFITSFGKKGSREGEFNAPSGIAIDSDGVLCVSDFGNSRIQMF